MSSIDYHLAERFSAMSQEAQWAAVEMIEYCIRNGVGMGQDEGLRRDGKPKSFRRHLEAFSKQKILDNR